MVRSLRGARLPAPDKIAGDTLAAMAEAGVFQLGAVVVGSIAFMRYAGLLGVRIPASLARTSDLDIAQFRSVAIGPDPEASPPKRTRHPAGHDALEVSLDDRGLEIIGTLEEGVRRIHGREFKALSLPH
jgi:hypothetical protein